MSVNVNHIGLYCFKVNLRLGLHGERRRLVRDSNFDSSNDKIHIYEFGILFIVTVCSLPDMVASHSLFRKRVDFLVECACDVIKINGSDGQTDTEHIISNTSTGTW